MNIGQSIVHNFLRVIIAYITLLDILILTINIKLDDERKFPKSIEQTNMA